MVLIKPKKIKLEIVIECDSQYGFQQACKRIEKDFFTENQKGNISAAGDWTCRYILREKENLDDLIEYRFDRQIIDGKERIVMVIPSRMNNE